MLYIHNKRDKDALMQEGGWSVGFPELSFLVTPLVI